MKTRVSLTIDEGILREIDKNVDGVFIRSRSDAVEKVLKEHVMDRRTVVILAGGDPEKQIVKGIGTYRPLVSIGKKTLIEDIVSKCREAGFTNVVIVGFPSMIAKMYEVLGGGEKYGVNIVYIEEERELGSAKSLELAKKYVRTDFLFLPSDFYIGFDLKKLLEFHTMNSGTATIGIHTRTTYDWKRGIVEMDGYRITNYEENPKSPKTRLIGIFTGFMKPEIFNSIPPGEVYWSLQEHVFPKLAKEGKLIGYPIAGEWVNVHEKQDVEKTVELSKRQK
jgi:NDP-sugar pyrophosphorylase family protein